LIEIFSKREIRNVEFLITDVSPVFRTYFVERTFAEGLCNCYMQYQGQ